MLSGVVLEPEDETSFVATWRPEEIGTDVVRALVNSTDPDRPVVAVKLMAQTEERDPAEERDPDIVLSPAHHDFGMLDPAGTDQVMVEIHNAGDANLVVHSAYYTTSSGDLSFDPALSINGSFPWLVSPGATLQTYVEYAPMDGAADSGTLTVVSSDPDTPEATATQVGNTDTDIPAEPNPPEWIDACPPGTRGEMTPEEIYVLSWDGSTATGTLWAPHDAWYHLYDADWAESGAAQLNESAYLRIRNSANPSGKPRAGNCGDDWIIQDADNAPPSPGVLQYGGTFWLLAGDNEVSLLHYCPLYRDGECPAFHEDSVDSQTCWSSSVNSVHMVAEAVCVMEASSR
jgi:hypothetical protein